METDYSTPLINVFSETSIQQKHLHTSVKNLVLFLVMDTEPTSVNNVVLFQHGDILHKPFLLMYAVKPQSKKSSHFSEKCSIYFQLCRQIPLK